MPRAAHIHSFGKPAVSRASERVVAHEVALLMRAVRSASQHCFCRKVFDVSCFKDFNTVAPAVAR